MSDDHVVRQAAPTLVGLKTGSLFPCRCESRQSLNAQLRVMNRRIGPKGLRIIALRQGGGRALVYLYRPKSLSRDLAGSDSRRLLAELGYDSCRSGRCLAELRRRLTQGGDFPHEIGLFLGYPPEDVRGFIENRGRRQKCSGVWKVYGDEAACRRRFEVYRRCGEICRRRLAAGATIEKLAVAVR